jgi:hypothetical protein
MLQSEIIAEIMQRQGFKKKAPMMRAFNENMGVYAITRETWRNWERNKHRCDPRILNHAQQVYQLGDWRHEMAARLMEVIAQPVEG